MGRFFGSLLIAVVCAYYGFAAADRLKKRKDFLTSFLNSLSFLETEICFGNYDLKSVFKRLDDKKLCGIYADCAERITDLGIRRAWKESVGKTSGAVYLKTGDADALLSLTAELGMSDAEGQKKMIARTSQLISQCSDDAYEEYARLGRVYRSCGVLTGVFVVIMFL